jgi:hypothetical protein
MKNSKIFIPEALAWATCLRHGYPKTSNVNIVRVPRFFILNLKIAFRDLKVIFNKIMDIERLYRVHRLIQQEATGTPDEFAELFHIKRRQLFYLLCELREYGAEIEYNTADCTYYYTHDFDFFRKIGIESLSGKENKTFLQEILKKMLTVQCNCTGSSYFCRRKNKITCKDEVFQRIFNNFVILNCMKTNKKAILGVLVVIWLDCGCRSWCFWFIKERVDNI